MAFTQFLQDDPLYSREQIMQWAIEVADELDMPDKRGACIIAGIAVAQEVGVRDNDPPYERRFWCPANYRDADSFNFPHDSISDDGRSVGVLQQQKGPNGELWWGSTKDQMTPKLAITTFMTRLKKLGYSAANAQLANNAAQGVQQSGVPNAYAQWFDDITALYAKVAASAVVSNPDTSQGSSTPKFFVENNIIGQANNFQNRYGQKPRLFVLHTEEGGMWGKDLAAWMANNGVSYHYAVDPDGTAWDLIDTDYASWSVLDANNFSINLVFASSYSNWSRIEWLSKMGGGIKTAAYLAVQDCKKYGIPIQLLVGNNYSKLRTQGGITDHNGITVGLGIGNHTDVGKNFPWDVFLGYVQQFANATEEDDMFTDEDRALLQRIDAALNQPVFSRSIYKEPNEGSIGTVVDALLNTDGMEHMELVERSAVLGDADSIRRVVRAAAGQGAFTDDATIKRAKAVLKQVPEDVLKEYA